MENMESGSLEARVAELSWELTNAKASTLQTLVPATLKLDLSSWTLRNKDHAESESCPRH